MRIVILGGTGHLGSRTVQACRAITGAEVLVASRRGPLQVDTRRPATFEALRGADVIVDLTNATRVNPEPLARWCLAEGLVLIEATSDAQVVERLAALSGGDSRGTLVLGGGIFTGISNLMAAHVAKQASPANSLTFAVSTSPFSGGGQGTVDLMTAALEVKAVAYRQGHRVDLPLARGPTVRFDGVDRPTLVASLAEPFMLHASTGAPEVQAYFSPRPAVLVALFLALPVWLLTSPPMLWLMSVYFTLLRRVLLAGVSTRTELVAEARAASEVRRVEVTADDGMLAGGAALAAMAEALAVHRPAPGVHFIDQLVTLEPIVARANVLAGHQALVTHV